MALPIKEYITLDVLNVLNGVKIDAGFNTDIEATRVEQVPTAPDDSKCVLYEGDEQPEDAPSYGHDGFFQPYTIRAWVVEPEDGDAIEQRLGVVGKDICKAVMVDPHRNDKAYNTRITGLKTYPQNEPPAVDVFVEVHYRTLQSDPFNQ